jgi:hypothetical protein
VISLVHRVIEWVKINGGLPPMDLPFVKGGIFYSLKDRLADGFLPIELHAKNLFSPQAVP